MDFGLPHILELRIGPHPDHPAFETEAERRQGWERERDRLLAASDPGHRPWAWWRYDAPEPLSSDEHQTLQLDRLGLLADAEVDELQEKTWPLYEKTARAVAHGDDARYWERRRFYGVPDWF
jgi:hypothetical protein